MVRIKRGVVAHKRRKNILSQVKGFHWGRKSKYRLAKDALIHAWQYAYRDRKVKKRVFRATWQQVINAAVREEGMSYSRLIKALKDHNITLDRKVLAGLAKDRPEIFKQVVTRARS